MAADVTTRISELIWKTDNRTAIRGLKQIAEQSDETKDSLTANADEESLSMDRVREHTDMLRDSMSNLAGIVGLGGVAFGLKDLVEGGERLQASQSQLDAALRSTGQEAGGAASQLEKMAAAMSTRGGFSTTENLAALTQFVRETHSATEAQKMLTLATNIARGTNQGLSDTTTTVAKAYTGQARGLQSLLGPMVSSVAATVGLSVAHQRELAQLQQNAAFMSGPMKTAYLQQNEIADHITARQTELAQLENKHATATQILAAATKYFSGATSAYSRTAQGQMSNLRQSVQNLTESLGKALLPAFEKIIGIAEIFAKVLARHKTIVMAVTLAVAGLGAAFGAVKVAQEAAAVKTMLWNKVSAVSKAVTEAYKAALEGQALATDGVTISTRAAAGAQAAWNALIDQNPLSLAIEGLVLLAVAIVELVLHFKAVKRFAIECFHGIADAATAVWEWLQGAWQTVEHVLAAPFDAAERWIVGAFQTVEGAIRSTVQFIEKVFATVFNAITFPFRKAFDFVKGAVHDIQGVIGGVGGFLSHPFGLSAGGTVPAHLASGGIDWSPIGSDVVPAMLTPGEGIVNTDAMRRIGGAGGLAAINSGIGAGVPGGLLGGGAGIQITPRSTTVTLNDQSGRVIGEMVTQWALNRAARGVGGGGVGGSLVTAAPGFPA
jgi:hypothetical protein